MINVCFSLLTKDQDEERVEGHYPENMLLQDKDKRELQPHHKKCLWKKRKTITDAKTYQKYK